MITLNSSAMSSSSSDMESLTTARGSVFSAVTRKWKVALSVFLLLGAVAAIGVCAAVVVASTSHGGEGEGEQESSRSMEELTVEVSFYIIIPKNTFVIVTELKIL